MSRLAFDLETDGLLPELTRIHSLVTKDLDTGELVSFADQAGFPTIEDGLRELATADLIAAHNAIRFDIPAIKKCVPNWQPTGTVRDTLILSQLQHPEVRIRDQALVHQELLPKGLIGRHSLEAWGHRLRCHKGDYKGGWDTWTPELQAYCEQDTKVLAKLWESLNKDPYNETAVEMEHRFAAIMHQQEQTGWPFDEAAAIKLYSKLLRIKSDLEVELEEAFPAREVMMKSHWWVTDCPGGGIYHTKKEAIEILGPGIPVMKGPLKTKTVPFNPGSRDQIAERLTTKYNWYPAEFTPGGKPKIDETVLSGLPYPEAKVLGEFFLVQKRISQLAEGDTAWLKMVRPVEGVAKRNVRMHGQVRTLGAITRRCSHNKPNMSAVPSVNHPYGKECRSLFFAPPGYLMVGADASGLELRCLAHYLTFYDQGDYGRTVTTGDVHSLTMTNVGLPDRETAKTFIYALLYGAGDTKLGSIINKGARAGKKLRSKFFASMPAFAMLMKSINRRMDTLNPLKAIDGGALVVRSQHSALNTLLQSAGAIAIKTATVLFYDRCRASDLVWGDDYWIAGHFHDELQIICKEGLEDEIGRTVVDAIKEAGENLGFRCPLDAEYKVGRTWADTH